MAEARPARDSVQFDSWVAARGPAMLRLAYTLTGNASDAEDVVQDALSRALPRWDRISRVDNIDAYVRRMVINAHTSWWRKWRRRESPTAEVVLPPVKETGRPGTTTSATPSGLPVGGCPKRNGRPSSFATTNNWSTPRSRPSRVSARARCGRASRAAWTHCGATWATTWMRSCHE